MTCYCPCCVSDPVGHRDRHGPLHARTSGRACYRELILVTRLVESVIQPFFAELGAPARDLVCKALEASIKPALKYRLVRFVLPAWPREVLVTLPLDPLLQQ